MAKKSRLRDEIKQTRPFRSPGAEATMGLLRTADLVRRRFETLYAPYGITNQQYNVLRILRGARPEPLPTMEIADRMIEQAPGITRLLDRLEEKGLVSRERRTDDRRRVLCTVTAAGLELLGELEAPVEQMDDELVGMLSQEDVTRLIELLDRVRSALDGDTGNT